MKTRAFPFLTVTLQVFSLNAISALCTEPCAGAGIRAGQRLLPERFRQKRSRSSGEAGLPGIVDSHNHIIDPERFPYAPNAGYTPRRTCEIGTMAQFSALLDTHHVRHALLVQPSCYAADNRAMLDAIATAGRRYRGIAVVDPAVTADELKALAGAGIVGIRLNLLQSEADALERTETRLLLDKVAALGWLVQIYASPAQWKTHARRLADLRVRVMVDHWGSPVPADGVGQPGFQAILEAASDAGNWVVKFSAPYRLSAKPPFYPDLDPFVAPLISAFGAQNCVWGSDWPYLNTTQPVNYAALLAALRRWLPDAKMQRLVLWDNPVALFGFD